MHTKRIHFSIPTLLIAALPAASAHAAMITTADGNGADTFVSQTSTISNSGTNAVVTVRTSNRTGTLRYQATYARFDVSDFLPGSYANVEFGIAFVDATQPDLPVDVFGLNDGVVGQNWNETGITYDNAPGLAQDGIVGDDNDIDPSETTSLGTLSPDTGNTGEETTLSSTALTNFLNTDTDGLVTLILVRDPQTPIDDRQTGNHDFASKEHLTLDPPRLSFDATLIPEPAALALVAFGGVLFAGRRVRL